MDKLLEWIGRMDPNNVPFMIIFFMTIIFIGALIWFKIWPFVEKDWWPAVVERQKQELVLEREQNSLILSMRDAVIALKEMTATLSQGFQQHSNEARTAINDIGDRLLVIAKTVEGSK